MIIVSTSINQGYPYKSMKHLICIPPRKLQMLLLKAENKTLQSWTIKLNSVEWQEGLLKGINYMFCIKLKNDISKSKCSNPFNSARETNNFTQHYISDRLKPSSYGIHILTPTRFWVVEKDASTLHLTHPEGGLVQCSLYTVQYRLSFRIKNMSCCTR